MTGKQRGKSLLIVLLVLVYFAARFHHQPPQPASAQAPETRYSAERAFAHVQRVAEAWYLSCDDAVDSWTAQFFPSDTQAAPITELLPDAEQDYLKAAAPVLDIAPPTLEVVSDVTEEGHRHLRVRVDSPCRDRRSISPNPIRWTSTATP